MASNITTPVDKILTATFLKDDLEPKDDRTYVSPQLQLGGNPIMLPSAYREYPVDRVFYNEEEYGVVYYNGDVVFCKAFELDFSGFVGEIINIERTASPYAGLDLGTCSQYDEFGYGDVISLHLSANMYNSSSSSLEGSYFFTSFAINGTTYGNLTALYGCNKSYGENGLYISNLIVTKDLYFSSSRNNLSDSNFSITAQKFANGYNGYTTEQQVKFVVSSTQVFNGIAGSIASVSQAKIEFTYYYASTNNGGSSGGGISTRSATRGGATTTGGSSSGGGTTPGVSTGYYVYNVKFLPGTLNMITNSANLSYDITDSYYWGSSPVANGQYYPSDSARCRITYLEASLWKSTTKVDTFGAMHEA